LLPPVFAPERLRPNGGTGLAGKAGAGWNFYQQDVWLLQVLPIAIVAVSLFKGLSNYGQAYLMSYAGNRVIKNIRDGLYCHLVLMPIDFNAALDRQLISRS
jgi:ABC-type bacteriocin/lantibiotic exporter with double-glycine peptidase domain